MSEIKAAAESLKVFLVGKGVPVLFLGVAEQKKRIVVYLSELAEPFSDIIPKSWEDYGVVVYGSVGEVIPLDSSTKNSIDY